MSIQDRESRQDREDIIACAAAFLTFKRCRGGRKIVDGGSCVHCGNTNPDEECGEPMKQALLDNWNPGDTLSGITIEELLPSEAGEEFPEFKKSA